VYCAQRTAHHNCVSAHFFTNRVSEGLSILYSRIRLYGPSQQLQLLQILSASLLMGQGEVKQELPFRPIVHFT